MSLSQQPQIKLSQLLQDIAEVPSEHDVMVSGVSEYSNDVEQGDVFIANTNLAYCQQAIDKGASAIIYESNLTIDDYNFTASVPVIKCENLAEWVSQILVRLYGDNINKINTLAITGTDGKSSVAHLITQALECAGDACALVGTLGVGRLHALSQSTHTTPPKAQLAKHYNKFNQMGCKYVALEASSHGIHQGRLNGMTIHTAVLTNISRDHLDYHKTIENYIQAKAALFFQHDAKFAVVNMDDEIGIKWCEELAQSLDVVSYSLNNPAANAYASNIEYLPGSTRFCLHIRGAVKKLHMNLMGEFNVHNVLAVAAVMLSLKKTNQQIFVALSQLDAVPGRMQRVLTQTDKNIIVDYAHTPAALHAAIKAIRAHNSGKLVCVFGCGGERDQGKREQMGAVATTQCDYVVITSDNPRGEPAKDIINDIQRGCIKGSSFTIVVDREKAIQHALSEPSDAVLIAGKGHEKYQFIGDKKIAFDDVEVVQQQLQRMAHG